MNKIRVGVIGAGRGDTMIEYCRKAGNAEVVAVCEKRQDLIDAQKQKNEGLNVTYYTDYDEFLKHDMDAVVLANYANEHAPFAIKAMKSGKHVFSEVLPCQTMKEAVELIVTVEQTGLVYAYGENYCYMSAPYEMRRLYKEGKIGELEYAECEYVHNCENIWPDIAYGDKNHWRNNMYSTFYCTHSIGPIIHSTGLRPVAVTGFEPDMMNERHLKRMGAKSGHFGIEMIRLNNGAIVKSIHGGLYQGSIWYSMYGSKGRMESARECVLNGWFNRIYVKADENSGDYTGHEETYLPEERHDSEEAKLFGHGGSDYYSMYNFIEKIKGNKDADTIDVYEALDMFLPGMFAYRSIMIGGFPVEVPNLRDKAEREKWRNDTACTDPAVAGDMLIPVFHKGNADIPDEVYDAQRKKFEENVAKKQLFVAGKDEYKEEK